MMTTVGPGLTLAGRYRLTDHIAGGGMGDVWRCTDEVLGRTVAVKVLLPALVAEPGFSERFRDEARTMATINHPGVVNVYDYGSDQGVTYLVMEYVEGDALSKTLARVGRLTPARTMSLMAQAADALQAAHEKGIVHRDVKPANLLVRPNGTLVLTDFGIARSASGSRLTAVGAVLGTASYISPEQASGADATPASDVYGLGVVAYQCLSGRRPFEGGSPIEIALQHVDAVPPPLPADIPPVVRALVDRCLAKAPGARWPSAASLAAAARLAATGQTSPQSAPAGRPISPAPASPTRPGTGNTATRPVATQVMSPRTPTAYRPPNQAAGPYAPARRPAPPPPPPRSRVGVVVLGVILAILVVLLAALVASAIKKHRHDVLCSNHPNAAQCTAGASADPSVVSWLPSVTTVTLHRSSSTAGRATLASTAKVSRSSVFPAGVK
jgi:serine/threonine-protein kinase